MNQAMSYHLVFAFEPFSADSARTALNGTEMGSVLRVNIRMRTTLYQLELWESTQQITRLIYDGEVVRPTSIGIEFEKAERYSPGADICRLPM